MLEGLHQFAPTVKAPSTTDLTDSFTGDTFPVEYNEFYPLINFPSFLTLKAWNTDTQNDHQIIVGIGILPQRALIPMVDLLDLTESIHRQSIVLEHLLTEMYGRRLE